MNKRGKLIAGLFLFFCCSLVLSCDDSFEYSPYAANVKSSYRDLHTRNFTKLYANTTLKDTIRFAVFADPHYHYSELGKAVRDVNQRPLVDFVLVNGDMADHGYLKEYELFHEQMIKLSAPYFTVIGNHDYKSNGDKVYQQMYGHPNKAFDYQDNFFILFDDIFWESNTTPNMSWLEAQLRRGQAGQYKNIFVIAHIPPYGDQFTDEYETLYRELMMTYGADLSIHGHIHRFQQGDYYGDGVIYLAVESVMDREYVIVTAAAGMVDVEQIKF
ncbi:MAG: metallophosphoesterase [Bacteroidales bacterium]|nr:metallophosphoesterase [Bacteroidales bacterium]